MKLLWDNAHLNNLPKHLIERALSEQLAILTDMSYNKDPNRRQYVLHCVEDIKTRRDCVLPAVRHLHAICKSFSKNSATSYQKADKQILADLNRQHEIEKLLSMSLKQCHHTAVQEAERAGSILKPDTVVNDGYCHSAYVDSHLDLMKFFLKEGDLYLSWPRCKEVWETLVENTKAIDFDKDNCFEWFQKCLTDLEAETQQMFFEQKLLKLSPSQVSHQSFNCFKSYFESINLSVGHLRKSISPSLIVEHLELIGLDYLWNLITECPKENIADDAIEYLLNMSFLHVSTKLKKDAGTLHKKFINNCFSRLKSVNSATLSTVGRHQDAAVQEGCELETSISKDPASCDTEEGSPRTLTSISISKSSTFPINAKGTRMQKIRRLLLLAERYVSTIEETHPAKRTILPHAASFFGRAIKIKIMTEGSKKEDFSVNSHTNELVGEVKKRIAEHKKQSVDQITLYHGDTILSGNKERCLVGMVGHADGQIWTCKSQDSVTTSLSSSTALVVYQGSSEKITAAGDASMLDATKGRISYLEEQEKSLPGVVMAAEKESQNEDRIFTLFYSLANLEDSSAIRQLRRLIHLIPTDEQAIDSLQIIRYHATPGNDRPLASASPSPKLSPRYKKLSPSGHANLEEAKIQLAKLFDAGAEGMSPFRVLYNLEVLSGKLMPTNVTETSQQFCQDFLECGGLRHILNVFEKDSLPVDTDYDIRQSIYLITLQLGAFLLCGQTPLGPSRPYDINACVSHSSPSPASEHSIGASTITSLQHSSPIMKPTPPKKSALDSSLLKKEELELPNVTTAIEGLRSPIAACASKIVSTMLDTEFSETISCLMRVAWSAAAGNLKLAASTLGSAHADQQSTRFFATRRSRDSSTGSSGSTGSDPGNVQLSESLHAGVCGQQLIVSAGDAQIAGEALDFLVKCLQLRNHNISIFYNLPLVNDFIIDTLLGSPSEDVRKRSCEQFVRLSKIRITNRNLNFELCETSKSNMASKYLSPKQFLTKALLKTPVPLWMPSCKARGISHAILAQCSEYFELRCYLLRNLSKQEQDLLGENANQMMEDELTFLNNFTPCHRLPIDCILIAGHLRLMEALVTCDGINKTSVGTALIPEILNCYLFPSSRLIADGALNNNGSSGVLNSQIRNTANPKCDTIESRIAAYNLLCQLAKDNVENTKILIDQLLQLHLSYDEGLINEKFEFEPPVERRDPQCNFVGLKNAGATCYMNSVLQILYSFFSTQILGVDFENDVAGNIELSATIEETIFGQLQNVFGHLLESKLKYYVPEKFWRCFRLFGQPVNVREQQDAFEFFTQIVDQVDEYLMENKKPKIFSKKFEGVFSDQKICHGCPHRYEREQTFMALNLTVKSNNLQESLDQFVKGELLEGENAYYCEKCDEKRNTIKRMCIRTLPQTLVIQLKRFHYDWETNRAVKFDDFFKFPWTLEMGPYTAEGIRRAEREGQSMEPDDNNLVTESRGGNKKDADSELREKKSSRKLSFSKTFLKEHADISHPYELVGIVVHSGQANAGHYYSYIKERRVNGVSNNLNSRSGLTHNSNTAKYGRWFKFNDTTVEEFEMNEDNLAAECFGGTYKAKKVASNLPEDRQRYWNAYMLFYEARKSPTSRTPSKKSVSISHSLANAKNNAAQLQSHSPKLAGSWAGQSTPTGPSFVFQSHRKTSTPSGTCAPISGHGGGNSHQPSSPMMIVSPTRTSEPPSGRVARESLSQLSDLLEKGDKSALFEMSRMPANIEREINEENLRFLQNRDVYCEDYYKFILELASINATPTPANGLSLGVRQMAMVGGSATIPSKLPEDHSRLRLESVRLATSFLLNSYVHVKKRQKVVMTDIIQNIESVIEKDKNTCEWLVGFLAADESSLQYLRLYLVECSHREVREAFAKLIERALFNFHRHNSGDTKTDDVNRILATMVNLLEKDVGNHCKNSAQFFWVLAKFAEMDVSNCNQLFQLNAFRNLIKFLLGVDPEQQDEPGENELTNRPRRWPALQSREFGDLHAALAYLILSCNTGPHRSHKLDDTVTEPGADPNLANVSIAFEEPSQRIFPKAASTSDAYLEMPETVSNILYKSTGLTSLFIREAVSACREVSGSCEFGVRLIVDMLIQVSYCSDHFSKLLIEELMKQYNQVNSGELKNLSILLLEILIMNDELQAQRLESIIEDCDKGIIGSENDGELLESNKVHGLLALVKNNQISDSRRSYQCIKTLVNAANKSIAVKDKLLQDPEKWQWAVNWLKDKMSQSISGGANTDASSAAENSNYWTTSGTDALGSLDVISNDDATSTRIFHRTTSAQVILEEANALLAEFGGDASMAEKDNSVLMASLVSQDKENVQPIQEDTSSLSPASSPSGNRQSAIVPDIDPDLGTSGVDQMDTDNCPVQSQYNWGSTSKSTLGEDRTEDSEMPDLINEDLKLPSGSKDVSTSHGDNSQNKDMAGKSNSYFSDKKNKDEDWNFNAD